MLLYTSAKPCIQETQPKQIRMWGCLHAHSSLFWNFTYLKHINMFKCFWTCHFSQNAFHSFFLFAGCCTAWAENRSLALKHAFFFLPVPIKLWALSVIATLKLLRVILQVIMQKTWQASKTDNKQTKTKQTQPKTEKQKPPHGNSQVF